MTNDVTKVQTKTIEVAGIQFSAYRLPDNSYRVSLNQFAKALGVEVTNLKRAFKGVTLESKRLQGKGFKGVTE